MESADKETVVRAVAYVARRSGCPPEIAMDLLCDLAGGDEQVLTDTARGILRDLETIDDIIEQINQDDD
ncbi:MAG: hypothetical protein JWL72_2498 [Ilumatobacteraceae bacterium]|nr:hypothetical protein [Ilumatobacteraceae bacterium]MCU1389160.1 hypothetical protein [Ilumatobacteraceae bacterium]